MTEILSFSSEEALNDSVYACSNCNGDKGRGVGLSCFVQAGYSLKSLSYVCDVQEAIKQLSFKSLPPTLAIQLKVCQALLRQICKIAHSEAGNSALNTATVIFTRWILWSHSPWN